MKSETNNRKAEFRKNTRLEYLLIELNDLLGPANKEMVQSHITELQPKLFIHGPPRSGTTLFTQWLSITGLATCPSNLLSRFYGAPVIGARIQQLLTSPYYSFRDEIFDFNSKISFQSENGKTRGALSPNEFWYFWRRFLPFDDLDYLPDEQLLQRETLDGLRDELNALANIFEQPFALKAMIMNQSIPVLCTQFSRALFIQIHRSPIFNIQSILEARKRQYGNIQQWYSFRIREYPDLKDLDPLESVAGQIAAINRSIEKGLQSLPDNQKITICYETFCNNPRAYHEKLIEQLSDFGVSKVIPNYVGPSTFPVSDQWRLQEYSQQEAEATWVKMQDWANKEIP